MDLEATSLHDPRAQALIAALNHELSGRYPEEGEEHFRLDPDEVGPGRGAFLLALDRDGTPLGCGAIRRVDETRAEVKRMYTVPAARGRGVGALIIGGLEAAARRLGVSELVLETGIRQPEAIRLYEKVGFVRTPPYGPFVGNPLSVCMTKPLR
jgi:GNAT superfamily N-acetyltransferase